MPSLQFLESERVLFVHLLRSGRTLVGRSDRCDVALPCERVSRVHCVIDQRSDGWWLADRSRHGTAVNGHRVERSLLGHGDRVTIGTYTAVFHERDPEPSEGTTVVPLHAAAHEELLDVTAGGIASARAEIVFERGPLEGHTVVLDLARTTLGGRGADVFLGVDLPRTACRLRTVRGRVMVEPADSPVWLAGARVRELTPMLPGEELRIADHGLVYRLCAETEVREDLSAFGEMVGSSLPMRQLFGILHRIARHDAPVLVNGPSGTGKELAARGLHTHGPRRDGPFVAVNCAAIADTLFESELFGHEKGSFTGATQQQDGAFHLADGGTLFLDEIGELKLDAQAKLLRALESGEVRRVGGRRPEYPDVRIIAATNRDLAEMVRNGTFREDLYFRLAVLTVAMPSLAERGDDVLLIARTLLQRSHPGAVLAADAAARLRNHPWPGNVRELRNVLTRAFVLGGPTVHAEHIAFDALSFRDAAPTEPPAPRGPAVEIEAVLRALERHNGNRSHAARDLGIPRSTLLYKLRQWELDGSRGLDDEDAK